MSEEYPCDKRIEHDHEECIEDRIKFDGIPRCYMCGDTATECDGRTDENGFNECDWLAEK